MSLHPDKKKRPGKKLDAAKTQQAKEDPAGISPHCDRRNKYGAGVFSRYGEDH